MMFERSDPVIRGLFRFVRAGLAAVYVQATAASVLLRTEACFVRSAMYPA